MLADCLNNAHSDCHSCICAWFGSSSLHLKKYKGHPSFVTHSVVFISCIVKRVGGQRDVLAMKVHG